MWLWLGQTRGKDGEDSQEPYVPSATEEIKPSHVVTAINLTAEFLSPVSNKRTR
jgi:hypothetical protein